MKRRLATVILLSLVASTAFSSLYKWNPKKRVPITLREALDKADDLLREEGEDRYCIQVSLYGNKEGDGKSGAWNLYFAAEDGSLMQVAVDMDGKTQVKPFIAPIDWTRHKGRRTGLDDVKARLEQVLIDHGIDASIEQSGEKLTCSYRTREFLIYKAKEDGSYGEDPIATVGPKPDGFILEAEVQTGDSVDRGLRNLPMCSYYSSYRHMHLLTTPESYLRVEIKSGLKCDANFKSDLRSVFGETVFSY
ncbi:MAG: hypothetical protein AAGG48_08020 [Planctomycetota bacterium]